MKLHFILVAELLLASMLSYSCHHQSRAEKIRIQEIPGSYVYSITEHNDSIYFSTQSGQVFRFSPDHPDSLVRMGNKRNFFPLRTIAFTKNNKLYASSYETGVHEVLADTMIALPKIYRTAWAMKLDAFDKIWLAGRQGVFHECGDSLSKITSLYEVYDVDFYSGKLVAGHRQGVTMYDSATGTADTTFCKGTVCWTIDIFDSLCVIGGVDMCALILGRVCTEIPLTPKNTIPWSIACDKNRTLYLATQNGLYRILCGSKKAECIGYHGKCIKSVYIDTRERLWVGRYYEEQKGTLP